MLLLPVQQVLIVLNIIYSKKKINVLFSYYMVKLTLEAEDKSQLEAACKLLEEKLPKGNILPKHIQFDKIFVQSQPLLEKH